MNFKLKPAPRVSLSEFVLERLLASIHAGRLQPGERLPTEANLSAMLGVGRSSVREALRVLVFMGLVESKPGRGTIVTLHPDRAILPDQKAFVLQSSAMADLYEVRRILEGGAAALAAERAAPGDLAALERAAKEVERRVAQQDSYFQENVEFHLAIARASHNHVLFESLKRLLGQVREFRKRVTDPIRELPARDVAEHRGIIAAIRAGDRRRAQTVMTRHIESTIRAVRLRRVDRAVPHPPGSGSPTTLRRGRKPDGSAPM
jgi:GntR family transcriptional regulator, transcriptional repressor for pyruvate dehydrogenase complex